MSGRFEWRPGRVLTSLTLLWLGSCSHRADDCQYTLTCGDFAIGTGGGDAGAVGGATGSSSSSSIAGSSTATNSTTSGGDPATGGSLGVGGVLPETGGVFTSGGDLGSGGIVATGGVATGGAPTCDPACTGDKPVCNLGNLTCVECTKDDPTHCSTASGKPTCNTDKSTCVECINDDQCATNVTGKFHCETTVKNACVQCTNDNHCLDKTKAPYCDSSNSCVECLDNEDCRSPNASLCIAGRCSPCVKNSDCSQITGKGVCTAMLEPDAGAEANNECVECTGTQYNACSTDDAGPINICDSLTNTCSEFTEHSAKACQPCISDAQCQAGQLCVNEVFEYGTAGGLAKVSVGYFCFDRQDSPNLGNDCTKDPPYVKAVSVTSIDGQKAYVCSLLKSTCPAMNQFRQTDCWSKISNAPDNSVCGAEPGIDSKCVPYGTTQYRCTVPCLSADDCPSTNPGCDTSTHLCKLL